MSKYTNTGFSGIDMGYTDYDLYGPKGKPTDNSVKKKSQPSVQPHKLQVTDEMRPSARDWAELDRIFGVEPEPRNFTSGKIATSIGGGRDRHAANTGGVTGISQAYDSITPKPPAPMRSTSGMSQGYDAAAQYEASRNAVSPGSGMSQAYDWLEAAPKENGAPMLAINGEIYSPFLDGFEGGGFGWSKAGNIGIDAAGNVVARQGVSDLDKNILELMWKREQGIAKSAEELDELLKANSGNYTVDPAAGLEYYRIQKNPYRNVERQGEKPLKSSLMGIDRSGTVYAVDGVSETDRQLLQLMPLYLTRGSGNEDYWKQMEKLWLEAEDSVSAGQQGYLDFYRIESEDLSGDTTKNQNKLRQLYTIGEQAKKFKANVSLEPTKVNNTLKMFPVIQQYAEKYDIPAEVIFAQWAVESGYGEKTPIDIVTGQNSYNYFGIKGDAAPGPAGTVMAQTKEVFDSSGEKVPSIEKFRAYHNWGESLEEHAQLLNKVYRPDSVNPTVDEWLHELQKRGYASALDYEQSLQGALKKWGLYG